MKLLAIIFALYTLLLPCVPCTDTEECTDVSKTGITTAAGNHDDHQHENEACNPFCSCTCCGHIFTPNFHVEKVISLHAEPAQKLQFSYNNISLSSDFSGNIWQPPRFG